MPPRVHLVSCSDCRSNAEPASIAFLPSSFAMYANTLAMSYALQAPNNRNKRRTLFATLAFATGAIVGWPFALAVAFPFVLEELLVTGSDPVTADARPSWLVTRWTRLFTCGAIAALLFVSSSLLFLSTL